MLFDHRVSRILSDASGIASDATLIERLHKDDGLISPAYDLRASARSLREAADKLDAICNRSTQHAF